LYIIRLSGYTLNMRETSEVLLREQRLLANGFVVIEPLYFDKGWWNIGLHHTNSGKILHIPGSSKPLIETSPVFVSGFNSTKVGKIALTFSMVNHTDIETLRVQHQVLAGAKSAEFSNPRVGGNNVGVVVSQEFGGKIATAEYCDEINQFKVTADAVMNSRGITPYIQIAEKVGAIKTGFNDDALVGLIHLAHVLAQMEPIAGQS